MPRQIANRISLTRALCAWAVALGLGPAVAQDATPVTLKQATDVFARTCLATLPKFEGFDAAAKRAGLTPVQGKDGLTPYQIPGKTAVVVMGKQGPAKVCAIGFGLDASPDAVGQAFQRATQAKTGAFVKSYSTSRNEFALKMQSEGLLIYQTGKRRGLQRHNIFATIPVTSSDLRYYLRN